MNRMVWEGSNGNVRVCDMETSHLVNVVNYMRRKIFAKYDEAGLELWEADMMATSQRPSYAQVINEAHKRGIDLKKNPVRDEEISLELAYKVAAVLNGRPTKFKLVGSMLPLPGINSVVIRKVNFRDNAEAEIEFEVVKPSPSEPSNSWNRFQREQAEKTKAAFNYVVDEQKGFAAKDFEKVLERMSVTKSDVQDMMRNFQRAQQDAIGRQSEKTEQRLRDICAGIDSQLAELRMGLNTVSTAFDNFLVDQLNEAIQAPSRKAKRPSQKKATSRRK